MIDNIIPLDKFRKVLTNPSEMYLSICKEQLDPDDYEDLIEAINSEDHYRTCDIEIQDLVDGYYYNYYKN